MKKNLLLILLCFVTAISCKEEKPKENSKEVSEKVEISKEEYYLSQINKILLNEDLDRISFKEEILPLTNKLLAENESYKMINIIAQKAVKEPNPEIFSISLLNFKNELLKKQ